MEVDGDVQRDLASVNRGQQLIDVVLEVQEVHEGVVIQAERLDNLSSDGVDVRQRLQVHVGELSHHGLDTRLQGLVREERWFRLGVSTSWN